MTRKILESCPSCGGALEISEVRCLRCATQVRSHYRPCDFCALSDEQGTFLRIFLTSRGNLSEVEKRLGVSYPTVRAKLDELIARLEAAPRAADGPDQAGSEQPGGSERRAVLDAIARGELSAVDGLEKIRALGGRG